MHRVLWVIQIKYHLRMFCLCKHLHHTCFQSQSHPTCNHNTRTTLILDIICPKHKEKIIVFVIKYNCQLYRIQMYFCSQNNLNGLVPIKSVRARHIFYALIGQLWGQLSRVWRWEEPADAQALSALTRNSPNIGLLKFHYFLLFDIEIFCKYVNF